MANDASIYQQVGRPNVELESPQNALMKSYQLQNAQNQNRLGNLQLQDATDERASRNALASAYQKNVGVDGKINQSQLISDVAASGQGAKLPGIIKQLTEQETAQLTQHKAKIDQGLQELEIATRIGGSIKDQNSLDQARQLVTQQFGPEAAAKMPTVYDPAVIARNLQLATSTKDQLAQKQLEIDNKLKADKFAYDQKNDAANRGIAAGNLGVSRDRLSFEKSQPKGQYDSATGMLVDTRNATARPVTGPDGQPISTGGGKPSADYLKQAEAYQNMDDALTGYKKVLSKFNGGKMLNPTDRAEMNTAYQNTLLQAKEIYKLGVLNGGDERILTDIINNPLNLGNLVTPTKALTKQADDLVEIIKRGNANLAKVYRQKSIPLNSESGGSADVPADISALIKKHGGK